MRARAGMCATRPTLKPSSKFHKGVVVRRTKVVCAEHIFSLLLDEDYGRSVPIREASDARSLHRALRVIPKGADV